MGNGNWGFGDLTSGVGGGSVVGDREKKRGRGDFGFTDWLDLA
jgi:hypothetical protein